MSSGQIYTKSGDKGSTSLYSGERVLKDNLRVECYGTIDEANSMLGMAYSLSSNSYVRTTLNQLQKKLFVVCAELATVETSDIKLKEKINNSDVQTLEEIIDNCILFIGKQNAFVVPGVNTSSSALHVARTIVRRAERLIIRLSNSEGVSDTLRKYINRLSDCVYSLARYEEQEWFVKFITEKVVERMNIKLNKFDLKFAELMASYAQEKSLKINCPMVISVVDSGGNLILLHKMDDSLLVSIDISINKAFTANSLKMPTHKLYDLAQPGKPLYGIEATNNGRIVLFGGGYPIYCDGKVVGGFGISGGSVEEDMAVAEYVLDKIKVES